MAEAWTYILSAQKLRGKRKYVSASRSKMIRFPQGHNALKAADTPQARHGGRMNGEERRRVLRTIRSALHYVGLLHHMCSLHQSVACLNARDLGETHDSIPSLCSPPSHWRETVPHHCFVILLFRCLTAPHVSLHDYSKYVIFPELTFMRFSFDICALNYL